MKIGFRGLDVGYGFGDVEVVHMKHHRYMTDVVFDHGDDEVIADLLQAWISAQNYSYILPKCLVCLQHRISTSQRLRRLVIRSVEHLGSQQIKHPDSRKVKYLGPQQAKHLGSQEVKQVEVEEFAALLDFLGVSIDDMESKGNWLKLLLHVVRSPEGCQFLPHPYWELMVELSIAADESWFQNNPIDDDLQVMSFLGEERDKLERWSGFFWLRRRPKTNTTSADSKVDLEHVMLSLFDQRPKAVQKLEVQRSRMPDAPESLAYLRWIVEQRNREVISQQDALQVCFRGHLRDTHAMFDF